MTAPRTPRAMAQAIVSPATDAPRKPSTAPEQPRESAAVRTAPKPKPISRQEAFDAASVEAERAEISARHALERAAEPFAEAEATDWLAVAATHTLRAEVFGKIATLIERCGDGVIAARLNDLAQQEAEAAAALDALDDGEGETADLSSRSLKGVG